MAVRFSGDLRITVKIIQDQNYTYDVKITSPTCECNPKCSSWRGVVRSSADDQRLIPEDSSLTFDSIARSAISFMSAETDGELLDHVSMEDEDTWYVARQRKKSWWHKETA